VNRGNPDPGAGGARLQILIASVLWGTTGTSQALAPAGAEPLAVATVRVVLGAIALVTSGVARSVLVRMPLGPVVLAAASLVGAQLCFFAAVDVTGVAVGTVVSIGSSPIAAGALAWTIFRESPGRRWFPATALGVVGCVLLVLGGRSIDVQPLGIALALVVGTGYAGYTLSTKELVESHPPDAVIAAVFGLAGLCMAPLLLWVDLEWLTQLKGALIALHLGLITVAFAYSLFTRGLVKVSAATAVTLTLAEPLTAAILGIVVLDERLTVGVAAGVTLVLAGLLLLTLPQANGSR
jgi:drug/metabolite transporter, DME family